jgi:putative addiction module killer protein
MYTIKHYVDLEGKDPYSEWVESLTEVKTRARIAARIERLHLGLFGDCKPIDKGVWELRIDFGPGYRVYYALDGGKVVLLCEGGDKGTQKADIKRAISHWQDWQTRRSK